MKHPIIMPAIMALSAALPMTAAGAEPLQANRPQDNSEPLTNEIVRLDVEARADYQWRSSTETPTILKPDSKGSI